jgi:hypothetical protein
LWRIATIAKEAGLKFLSRNYQLGLDKGFCKCHGGVGHSLCDNHPTKITLHDDVKFSFYNKNIKSKQKPYYITAQEVLKENNYIPDNIYSHSECPTPPWHLRLFSLTLYKYIDIEVVYYLIIY